MNITLSFASYEELDAFCLAHVAGRKRARDRVDEASKKVPPAPWSKPQPTSNFETRLRDLLEEDEHLVMGGRDAMEKLEEANLLHLIPVVQANLKALMKLNLQEGTAAKNVAMLLEALAAVALTHGEERGFIGGLVRAAAAVAGLSYSYTASYTKALGEAGVLTSRQGAGTRLDIDPALLLSPGLLQQLRKEV